MRISSVGKYGLFIAIFGSFVFSGCVSYDFSTVPMTHRLASDHGIRPWVPLRPEGWRRYYGVPFQYHIQPGIRLARADDREEDYEVDAWGRLIRAERDRRQYVTIESDLPGVVPESYHVRSGANRRLPPPSRNFGRREMNENPPVTLPRPEFHPEDQHLPEAQQRRRWWIHASFEMFGEDEPTFPFATGWFLPGQAPASPNFYLSFSGIVGNTLLLNYRGTNFRVYVPRFPYGPDDWTSDIAAISSNPPRLEIRMRHERETAVEERGVQGRRVR